MVLENEMKCETIGGIFPKIGNIFIYHSRYMKHIKTIGEILSVNDQLRYIESTNGILYSFKEIEIPISEMRNEKIEQILK